MFEARLPYRGLVLLGRAFHEQSSGVLSLGRASTALRLVLRDGHIAAVEFPEDKPSFPHPPSGPDDSAQLRLERVLSEIGMRPASPKTSPRAQRNLRERMLAGLLDTDAAAAFARGGSAEGAVEVAGATEALMLEAIRRVPDPEAIRAGLGDLDQRLAATAGLAEERTLTLTEGYILSRVDGRTTAREVLQLVPLEPEETERTLLGLLVTGRLEYRPSPAAVGVPATEAGEEAEADGRVGAGPPGSGAPAAAAEARQEAVPEAPPEPEPLAAAEPRRVTAEEPQGESDEARPAAAPAAAPDAPALESPVDESPAGENPAAESPGFEIPAGASVAAETSEATAGGAPTATRAEIDHAALERRRELLEYFQALPTKNHFEVLGVEPGCTDAEVKRAYATLARKYHPDTHRGPGIEDLHDVLEAIFIRVGEAWEVLGDAPSRTSYEARFPPGLRRRATPGAPGNGGADLLRSGAPVGAPPSPPEAAEPEAAWAASEETIGQAQILLNQARYWDAIQMLEHRLPQMPPSKQQRRGRILLAKAYAKNPNWLRKAEDALLSVVREEPRNADAHYELGLLYKSGGMVARAQASFRRALDLRPDHREAAAELGVGPAARGAQRPGGGLLKRLFGRGKAS